jgi:hypothetical protein
VGLAPWTLPLRHAQLTLVALGLAPAHHPAGCFLR